MLAKTVAFLAAVPGSATLDDQKKCLGPDDYVILAGNRGFNRIAELSARSGIALERGDRVKIFDLGTIGITTGTLIRVMTGLLDDGVTIEIAVPGIVIEPGGDGQAHALLAALDNHHRRLHGIKAHPGDAAPPGRRRLLDPDKLPEIRAMLDRPDSTYVTVAQELGVARSTLFNYLGRYDASRRAGGDEQTLERLAKDAGDHGHVAKRETSQAAG
jgi:hypothetical protein